jgi:hypothetical protein
MDNHLHVLVRLDPGLADGWSDDEVLRRWIAVYPSLFWRLCKNDR